MVQLDQVTIVMHIEIGCNGKILSCKASAKQEHAERHGDITHLQRVSGSGQTKL